MTLQVIHPSTNWLYVQADQPFHVPKDVLVPGVTYREPDPGYAQHRCELPSTTWMLPAVKEWLAVWGAQPPEPPWRPPLRVPEAAADALDAAWDGLYAHQQMSVQFLLARRSAVLGLQMGLGKTAVSLFAAVQHSSRVEQPVFITAPKSLRSTWARELERMQLPGWETFTALEGTKPSMDALRGAKWIFCHYDILRSWWSFIAACRPIVGILDEAHLVKDARTKRGKAVSLAIGSCLYRYLLTGTPILNRVADFWALLTLASGPWTWGTPSAFRERYAGAFFDGHGLRDGGHVTNKEELQTRLASVYYRRTIAEVGINLPSMTQQIVEAQTTDADRAAYEKVYDNSSLSVDDMVNALLQRRASQQALLFINRLRKITASMKIPTTVEVASTKLLEGESVVIFTWMQSTAELLATKLFSTVGAKGGLTDRMNTRFNAIEQGPGLYVIHGGYSDKDRQAKVDRFQACGGAMIATIDSLSVGVTLHKARHVIIHDLDPVPNKMLQAMARVRRIGQVWPTTGTFVIAPNTIDEIWARIFQKKGGLIADAAGDEGPQSLSDLIEPQEVYAGLTRVLDWATRA